MSVDYNNFAKKFAQSRKNMQWPELEYFFSQIQEGSILDIWCGSWRLIEQYNSYFWYLPSKYLGLDLSQWLLDEAKVSYPDMDFVRANMLDVNQVTTIQKFTNIFLIASFHHLDTVENRQQLLTDLYSILSSGWKIFMTNWALHSQSNIKKYESSRVTNSENEFGSYDYNILFGENERYYHSFTLQELEVLSMNAGFKIIENKLFDWERNTITILEK
mgnify:CR=1 FL=1